MSNKKVFIGADLHKNSCYVTVMNKEGKISRQTEISTDNGVVRTFFRKYQEAEVAVESTLNWVPFYENLESLGCKVHLSNPLKTKAIASARIKTDKIDSRILADLLRSNLLPESFIQSRPIRDLKEIVRERASYVEIRTRIKNKIHAVLFKNNIKHGFSNLYGKKGLIFLKELKLREIYRNELDHYLNTLDFLNKQVSELETTIKEKASLDYDCKLLMTIPGISFYSSLMIKAEIGDIARFPLADQLCSYAGLVPSTYASADQVRNGRITKQGSKWLRKTLIDAVTSSCRNQNKFSTFYFKLKRKKGMAKARVATARKLCSVIFAMLTDKQPFREFTPVKQR